MTRAEFLDELRETLSGNMNESEVQNHVNYYNAYINEEMGKGKTEAEVLNELGSPFAIAKTVLMPYEKSSYEYETKEVTREESKLDDSAKKILTIVLIIVIGLVFLSAIFGLMAFVIRYAVPISVIVLVIYFLKKR